VLSREVDLDHLHSALADVVAAIGDQEALAGEHAA
jgi:hypothetical protein